MHRGLEYIDKQGVAHTAIDKWTFIAADGVEMPLEEGTSAFITMNPGYIGRAELPESLKALFRPITVVVPDRQLIMENMLMAEVGDWQMMQAVLSYRLKAALASFNARYLRYPKIF